MPPPPPPPPPPPSYGATPPPGYLPYQQASQTPNYASFGSRLGAVIIDGLMIFLISLPFDLAGWFAIRKAFENCYSIKKSDGMTEITCPDGALQAGWLGAAIALFVIGVIVGVVVYCKKVAGGQSWGHKAVGIRIVDVRTGGPISAGRVFGRQVCRIFSGVFCYLGYLWMLWDSQRQTWHDKMVNTIVIKA